jgi:hypothetical protein
MNRLRDPLLTKYVGEIHALLNVALNHFRFRGFVAVHADDFETMVTCVMLSRISEGNGQA